MLHKTPYLNIQAYRKSSVFPWLYWYWIAFSIRRIHIYVYVERIEMTSMEGYKVSTIKRVVWKKNASYIYICLYIHTRTHRMCIHIYIYIYVCVWVVGGSWPSDQDICHNSAIALRLWGPRLELGSSTWSNSLIIGIYPVTSAHVLHTKNSTSTYMYIYDKYDWKFLSAMTNMQKIAI